MFVNWTCLNKVSVLIHLYKRIKLHVCVSSVHEKTVENSEYYENRTSTVVMVIEK